MEVPQCGSDLLLGLRPSSHSLAEFDVYTNSNLLIFVYLGGIAAVLYIPLDGSVSPEKSTMEGYLFPSDNGM